MKGYYYHDRILGGTTVSKTEELPEGDFVITEYHWPDLTLWFIDDQEFTADERQLAYELYKVMLL